VSEALAEHYGFDAQGGVSRYDLSQNESRSGIMTQGSMSLIGGDESSTVRRGLFMLNQVLCSRMNPPPADVDTTPPDLKPGQSIRDVSEDRANNETCGVCHSQFEPMVWGLVPFDAVGHYSLIDEHENMLPEDGFVKLPGGEGLKEYSNAGELTEILASSQRTEDCALLKSYEFIMARAASTADSCSLAAARESVLASGGTYKDIIRAIIRSEKFSNITTERN